ncbi:hypothetical protein [Deinococcus hopiensis]|uniref:Uncharacterized protein n=1 Tax=Deinococcus hopiensis KR-140 TaxID=695939 RepID=A0A1W1VIP7_9DEIO|nr:hypothetical protein [Deinococcus hopiensis]SMB93153.1 hypothetical protein SAMN00790413_01868 [Deinococcus hopiensis KR-140]
MTPNPYLPTPSVRQLRLLESIHHGTTPSSSEVEELEGLGLLRGGRLTLAAITTIARWRTGLYVPEEEQG